MADSIDERLRELYTNPSAPTSFGSARRLFETAKKSSDVKKKDVDEWLSGVDAYTLHKPVRTKFKRRPTIVAGVKEQIQVDLMDVKALADFNDGTNFLLTGVDAFSRRAYVYPLASKSGRNVSLALRQLFDLHHFRSMQTDKGKEFYNSEVSALLRSKNVRHFSTENETTKASIVERFNRTLRNKMYRYITHRRNKRYITALPAMVESYNNAYHSSINTTPNSVSESNQEDVWGALYGNDDQFTKTTPPRFSFGDSVRISRWRGAFERGYTPNWSREIFFVRSVHENTRPRVYSIKDYTGEDIAGTFYETELQKVQTPSDDEYEIEEVIRYRGRGARREALVKWLGYPSSMNSWVKASDIV